MPLRVGYNGAGLAWPINIQGTIGPATDATLTPRPALAGLYKQTWTNPLAADSDAFIETGVAGPDTATDTYEPGDADWDGVNDDGIQDYARNVVIVVTHASAVVALSGTITGKNQYGKTITEAWSVTAGTTSKTFTGAVAFKEVTSITVVAAADATTDTVKAGFGKVFGLNFKNPMPGLVKELSAGSILTNGVVVAASASANADARGTYTPNGTPDAIIDWDVWYIVDDFNDLD